MRALALVFCGFISITSAGRALGEAHWPQFRGPGGRGVAGAGRLPVRVGPNDTPLWKTALPYGHSSPCVWGDRIFLTGLTEGKLETLCIDRKGGTVIWRRTAPAKALEDVHREGSPASATPTTDGRHVYVYFGSYGLLCYAMNGERIWTRPLPPPITEWGAASSPVLVGDGLVLNCDQDLGSYLLCVDAATGKTRWKVDRAPFRRGFGTPIVRRNQGVDEIIVPGSIRLVAYDAVSGTQRWAMPGLPAMVCTSPTTGQDLIFVAAWMQGTSGVGRFITQMILTPYAEFAKDRDKNADGALNPDEMPKLLSSMFSHLDTDKDGRITPAEWDSSAGMFRESRSAVLAIRPPSGPDAGEPEVVWTRTRALPYIPSPLHYDGRLYTIKDGGIVSCYDAATGDLFFRERLEARGDYYASPVAGDGKVYFSSKSGAITVIKAADALDVVARNVFDEAITATPALVDEKLYLRTAGHLYAFGVQTSAGN